MKRVRSEIFSGQEMESRGTVNESTPGVPSTDAPKKRRGGRPPGSKNKTKPPAINIMPTPSSGQAFAPWAHVVQVSAGDDVARAVAASACRLGGYISVISASGPVFPPLFRQPFPYTPVELNSKGHFFLISILPDGSGGMSAILAGPQRGVVLKGAFTGPLVAEGTVVVVVSAAPKPEFSRFAPNNSTTCAAPQAIRGGYGSAGENGRVSHQQKQCGEEQRPQLPSMVDDGTNNAEGIEEMVNYLMEEDVLPQLISPDMERRSKEMAETLGQGHEILPTSVNGAISVSSGGRPSGLIINSGVPESHQLQESKEDGALSFPSATGDGAEENQECTDNYLMEDDQEKCDQLVSGGGEEYDGGWNEFLIQPTLRQENQACTDNYLMEDDHQEECELVSGGGEEYDGGWNEFLIQPTFYSQH